MELLLELELLLEPLLAKLDEATLSEETEVDSLMLEAVTRGALSETHAEIKGKQPDKDKSKAK